MASVTRSGQQKAGLVWDKLGYLGMVFFDIVDFQNIVHGFARVFDADVVRGKNVSGGFVKLRLRLD